jgi:hypothetical protein
VPEPALPNTQRTDTRLTSHPPQTLIVPAVISLLLFLVSTYVALPLWRRYRQRYSQYLPVDRLSDQTSGFRHRVQSAMAGWLVPSAWRRGLHDRLVVVADADSDDGFESDEGEELEDVPISVDRRRDIEAGVPNRPEDSRRLSRE